MFGNPYYPQPMADNLMQMKQQYQPPQNSIVWVQGEAGAKSYLVGAGQSVLLMDSEESQFFIKTTDQSGMPLPLRKFKYEECLESHENTHRNAVVNTNEFITREEYNALETQINALSKRIEELKDESIISTDRKRKSSLEFDEYD